MTIETKEGVKLTVSLYTSTALFKARLAKCLMRLACRLVSSKKFESTVMVSFTDNQDEFNYELFGLPKNIRQFKHWFPNRATLGDPDVTLVRGHVVATRQPDERHT